MSGLLNQAIVTSSRVVLSAIVARLFALCYLLSGCHQVYPRSSFTKPLEPPAGFSFYYSQLTLEV